MATLIEGVQKSINRGFFDPSGKDYRGDGRNYFRDVRLTEIRDVDLPLPETEPEAGAETRISAYFDGTVEAVTKVFVPNGESELSRGRVPISVGVAAYGNFDGESYSVRSMVLSHGRPKHPGEV